MKQLITTIFLFICAHSFGQYTKEDQEVAAIFNSQDTIPRSVFLDSTFLETMKVKAFNANQIWASTEQNEKKIEQLFDIRMKFDSNAEALAFHKKYAKQNSEYGPEIRKHGVKLPKANELHVYRGAEMVEQMVSAYGIHMYCFLFVVDDYFVKVYTSCHKELKPVYFQPMIDDIVQRIQRERK